MYAVIQTGGKQYKVTNDEVIFIEKLDAEANDTVTFQYHPLHWARYVQVERIT